MEKANIDIHGISYYLLERVVADYLEVSLLGETNQYITSNHANFQHITDSFSLTCRH